MTAVTVVKVHIAKGQDGMFRAQSQDVRGLHVWGATYEQVCERAKLGIKRLYKLNHGLDVELHPFTEPKNFVASAESLCDSFAVARAA